MMKVKRSLLAPVFPLAVATFAACGDEAPRCGDGADRWVQRTELPAGLTTSGPIVAVQQAVVLESWVERGPRDDAGELRASLFNADDGEARGPAFRIASGVISHEIVPVGDGFHVYVLRQESGFVVHVDLEGNVGPRIPLDDRVVGGASAVPTYDGSARLNLLALQRTNLDPALAPSVVDVNSAGAAFCQSAAYDDGVDGFLASCFFEDFDEGALVSVDGSGAATTLALNFPGFGALARRGNDVVVVHVDRDVFATVVDLSGNVITPPTRIFTPADDKLVLDRKDGGGVGVSIGVTFDGVLVTIPQGTYGANGAEDAVIVALDPSDVAAAHVVDVVAAAQEPRAASNDDGHFVGFVEQPDAFSATFSEPATRFSVARTCTQ